VDALIAPLLSLTNETLASAIVIVAASILLYNLTRNLENRVARTSGAVLACVVIVYVGDVFVSLNPTFATYQATLRLQWFGIAFMPAALFHLSDALLATTGLPSRGRRRRVIRILYVISIMFVLLAAFTNALIAPVRVTPELLDRELVVSLRAGPLFPVYIAYFVIVTAFAFYNVQRARQRCLTRSTRRRMGYLQIALLTPAFGIFPFSVLLGAGQEFSLNGLALVNLTNLIVIFMLVFLAYPLSFFGSRVPDRVVKTELLRFFLRGPATGLLALITIIFLTPTTRILGLPGDEFLPFAVVAVVLLWQWFVALSLSWFERKLVYTNGDYDHFEKLQDMSERLLTRHDLVQFLDANLAASCDYLRVNTAFVSAFNEDLLELVSAVGPARPDNSLLKNSTSELINLFASENSTDSESHKHINLKVWHGYWIAPLYGMRAVNQTDQVTLTAAPLVGVMGIQARAAEIDLDDDERMMLERFARRSAQTLDDMRLQGEIFAALEGLLPQITITRKTAEAIEYKPPRTAAHGTRSPDMADTEQFKEQVRAALRHYWGGSGLSSSRLLELQIVRDLLDENEGNPTRALRSVLKTAIERQRPGGERKMFSPEWTLYNILQLRFIERAKVRDVAQQLALSEPTLYRRQDEAINAVADTLMSMEAEAEQREA